MIWYDRVGCGQNLQAGKKSPRLTQVGGANSDASAFAAWFSYCIFFQHNLGWCQRWLECCMDFLVFSLFFRRNLGLWRCQSCSWCMVWWSPTAERQWMHPVWSIWCIWFGASGLVHLLGTRCTPGVTFCDFLVRICRSLSGHKYHKVGSVGFVHMFLTGYFNLIECLNSINNLFFKTLPPFGKQDAKVANVDPWKMSLLRARNGVFMSNMVN